MCSPDFPFLGVKPLQLGKKSKKVNEVVKVNVNVEVNVSVGIWLMIFANFSNFSVVINQFTYSVDIINDINISLYIINDIDNNLDIIDDIEIAYLFAVYSSIKGGGLL